jgi:hypothetical protein
MEATDAFLQLCSHLRFAPCAELDPRPPCNYLCADIFMERPVGLLRLQYRQPDLMRPTGLGEGSTDPDVNSVGYLSYQQIIDLEF